MAKRQVRATTSIEDIRADIRAGFAAEAGKKLEAAKSAEPQFVVEQCFHALLDFQDAHEIMALCPKEGTFPTGSADNIRHLILQGILANRNREPLLAQAKLQQALNEARAAGDVQQSLDALMELARVYGWMGAFERAQEYLVEALALNAARKEQAPYDFLILMRLTDLYAEAERYQQASRYAKMAHAYAEGLDGSVHVLQFAEYESRVFAATGEEEACRAALDYMAEHQDQLPEYLRLRLYVGLAEWGIRNGNLDEAQAAHTEAVKLARNADEGSFARILVQSLEGQMARAESNNEKAANIFEGLTAWYRAKDLSVPLTRAVIAEAEARAALGEKMKAARLLSAQRDYCNKRGLQVQKEAVEVAMAKFGVPQVADIEENRAAGENLWRNRKAYVLQEQLGAGGQGSVFKAWCNARDMVVAYKRVGRKTESVSAANFAALRREVEAMSQAGVEGAARIIACGSAEDGVPYMIQDFIKGPNFRTALKLRGLPLAVMIQHVADISETLAKLHAKGVVHADVKPENIVLPDDGRATLVDFGIAQVVGRTPEQSSAATRAYAPPPGPLKRRGPQWRDEFAIGVILVECLVASFKREESPPRFFDRITIEPQLRAALSLANKIDGKSREVAEIAEDLLKPIGSGPRLAAASERLRSLTSV